MQRSVTFSDINVIERPTIMRAEHRRYIVKCYLITIFFLFQGLLQWLIIATTIKKHYTQVGVVCFLSSLILLTAFQTCRTLRKYLAVNYSIAAIIVELITVGTGGFVCVEDLKYAGLAILLAIIIWLNLIVGGAIIPLHFTPNAFVVSSVTFLSFITAIFCLIIFTHSHIKFYYYLSLVVFILSVLLVVVYHSMVVHLDTGQELPKRDILLAPIIWYMDFSLICLLNMLWIPDHQFERSMHFREIRKRKLYLATMGQPS